MLIGPILSGTRICRSKRCRQITPSRDGTRLCAQNIHPASVARLRPRDCRQCRSDLAASTIRVVLCLGMPARRVLAGSMWRLADGQHGSDQVVQRPGQVTLGDEGDLVIDAKMVDRSSRNRAVGRQGGQGTCEELLPWAGVAGRGGVNHPAPHGAVWADQGHDDPHQLSLSLQPHFGRHITTMAPRGHARPVTHLADCRKRDRARTQPSHERCRPRPAQQGRPAQDDTASRAVRRQRTAKRK